jgi:hypothetical protein
MRALLRLLVLSFALLAGQAYAACTSPAGAAGRMVYAGNFNTMAYCNGTNWVSMAGGVSVTVTGGGATPAGSSNDIQFNSSGALGADTGNFTYSSGLLKVGSISASSIYVTGTTGTISSTYDYSKYVSSTQGTFGSIGSGLINATGISITTNQTSVTTLYASGKVGVGVAAPADTMHVYSNTAGSLGLTVENHNSANGTYARLILTNDAANTAGLLLGSSGNAGYVGANGLAVGTFNSGALGLYTNNALRLYISSTSNLIGIGTSTPSATLDVIGSISATNVNATSAAGTVSATYGYFTYISATNGLGAGASNGDRITSGTTASATAMIANSATGIISITNLGVGTGYFNSNGVLTVPGISATANLTSVTTLYASSGTTVGGDLTVSSTALYVSASNGRVGIGTNTPVNTLDVSGTSRFRAQVAITAGSSSANAAFIINNAANNLNLFYVRGDGNVGIGGSAPGAKLVVSDNASALPPPYLASAASLHVAQFAAVDGSSTRIMIDSFGTGALSNIDFRKADGTAAAPSALQANDQIGNIAMFGYGATGYSTTTRGYVGMFAAQNWSDTVQGTYMTFATTTSGTAGVAERMRIDALGNIGINTTAPNATLDVNGTISASNVYVTGTSAGTGVVSATYGYFKYISATNGGGGAPTPAGVSGSLQFNGAGTLAGNNQFLVSGTTLNPELWVSGTDVPLLYLNNNSATNSTTIVRFASRGRQIMGLGTDFNANGGQNFWVHDYIGGGTPLFIDGTGNVGISTTSPVAKLDVNGTISATAIQVKTFSATCTSGISGTIRYNNVSNTMEYCTGSAWLNLGPSATTPVSFSAAKTGTGQTVAASTWTKIALNTVTFDPNSNFVACTTNCTSGAQTVGQSRYTPTVPGKYLFTGSVYCSGAVSCYAAIYKNGAAAAMSGNNGGTSEVIIPVTAILDMNGTGDYVELWGDNGGTLVNASAVYTYLHGVLLSPQGSGGGGTATPAGSTADVQFNSSGALAADTGNFTYASSVLKAPTVSATTISGTYHYGSYVSATTGTFGTIGSGLINATGISITTNQTSVTTLYASKPVTLASDLTVSTSVLYVSASSGNVGIGTATPSTALTVVGGQTGYFGKVCLGSSAYFGLAINNSGSADCTHYTLMGDGATATLINVPSGGYVAIGVNNGQQLQVASTGLVGIGTASPNAKLDVIGTISASNVYVTATTGTVSATNGYFKTISTTSLIVSGSTWGGGPTMTANWPDAILCVGGTGSTYLYPMQAAGGSPTYVASFGPNYLQITYNSNGTYNSSSQSNWGSGSTYWSSCSGTSIATLYTNGAAFNFVNGITATSSQRFKHDITTLTGGLGEVMAMRPVSFIYNKSFAAYDQKPHVGFVAEEIAQIDPRLVTFEGGSSTIVHGVQYENITAVLAAAVQELKSLFDGDHADIARLKADNDNLRAVVQKQGQDFETYKRAHP